MSTELGKKERKIVGKLISEETENFNILLPVWFNHCKDTLLFTSTYRHSVCGRHKLGFMEICLDQRLVPRLF